MLCILLHPSIHITRVHGYAESWVVPYGLVCARTWLDSIRNKTEVLTDVLCSVHSALAFSGLESPHKSP